MKRNIYVGETILFPGDRLTILGISYIVKEIENFYLKLTKLDDFYRPTSDCVIERYVVENGLKDHTIFYERDPEVRL